MIVPSATATIRGDSKNPSKMVVSTFANSFDYIFPGKFVRILDKSAAEAIWKEYKSQDGGRPKAIWDRGARGIVCFLYAQVGTPPTAGLSISMDSDLDRNDLHFARSFSKVFNEDFSRCSNRLATQELWRTLRSTQFLRSIARMSGFDSVDASSWIQSMESSLTLTYEGNLMHHAIVFFKKANLAIRRLRKYYVPFHGALSVQQALLGEKWIRPVVDGTRVVLVGSKSDHGHVLGLLSLSAMELPSSSELLAPHASIQHLKTILQYQDMALVSSMKGDLFILFGSDATFQKTQGRWRYLNYAALQKQLSLTLDSNLSLPLLRAAIDLSFERKGALFCVLNDVRDIKDVVPDYNGPDRANRTLRDSVKGLDITRWEQRQVITAAASTDGATILSSTGRLVDIACMIKPATLERVSQFGFSQLRSFPGARSTAAWNASFFGVTVKVSEDGPVSIWKNGKEIARV